MSDEFTRTPGDAYRIDNPFDGRGQRSEAPIPLHPRDMLMRGATPFERLANGLEDLSAHFAARCETGGMIAGTEAAYIAGTLEAMAELARIGDRQRVAALALAGRPVVEDGVVVVLQPAVRGGSPA